MYPVSLRWADALRTADPVCRVEVWRAGQPLGVELKVTSGTVRVDETQERRRSLTLECADVELMPDDAGDDMSPTDTDLKVFAGIQYTEGDREMIPVGVFRVESPSRQGLLAPLRIAASDYFMVLARARFAAPWNTPAGRLVSAEITDMIRDVLPWVDVIDLTGSTRRTKACVWEQDRSQALMSMASSIGAELFFDVEGRAILRVPPVVGTPVWRIAAGSGGHLVDKSVSLSSERVYNAVICSTAPTDGTPPISRATYQRSGPLRWRPGFQQPRWFASPLLNTIEELDKAGATILSKSLSMAQQVGVTFVRNPALQEGDTVTVYDLTTTMDRVIGSMSIPLLAGAMTATIRVDPDVTTNEPTA